MADVKWIKITVDMFEHDKLDFILSLPESDAIIIVWIRLLTLAGKVNASGYVLLTENIAYTEEMLSHKLRKSPSVIRLALETLKRLKMIEFEGEAIRIVNWDKHQNVDGLEKIKKQDRLRQQKKREKDKQLLLEDGLSRDCHVTVTGDVTHSHATDIELDLDLEKDTTTTANRILEQAMQESAATIENETVMDIHKKVFGTLFMSGLMSEYVNNLKSHGYQDTFIKELMLETGESGHNPSIRLMETIGARWMKEGIYTRAESKRRHDEEKRKVVSFQTKQQPQAIPKEYIPDAELMARVRAANEYV